jgi:hypothetical protein
MTLPSRLRRLLREERGITAMATALLIAGTVGLTATAVDLGLLFTAKGQLQNAADAAALAAAGTMIGVGANNQAVAQPSNALASAGQFASANQAIGVNVSLKTPPGNDFTIGYWDKNAGGFDAHRTGMGLTDPDDVTAVRVRVRRDDEANSPVTTYFARIFGINQVGVSAVSTAFLGYPATVPPGTVQLPLVVFSPNIANGSTPCCDDIFKLDNIAAWTSFSDYPNNATSVNNYLNGHKAIPDLKVGDGVYINGDEVSNGYFGDAYDAMKALYNARGVDTNHDHKADYWEVVLPVVDRAVYSSNANPNWPWEKRLLARFQEAVSVSTAWACGPTTRHKVVGFVNMKLTKVNNSDHSKASGTVECGLVMQGSSTGGDNFGTRAATAKLIR